MRTRVCAEPGCPNVAVVGKDEGRCPRHRRPKVQGSPDLRLPEHVWRKIRASVLSRDGGRCVRCGDAATQVDHIVPLAHGGDNTMRNLRSVCHPCHVWYGYQQRGAS
jgi:5-methylcytosine-specific restriction protein A